MNKAIKYIVALCSLMSLSVSLPSSAQVIKVSIPGTLADEIYNYSSLDTDDLTVRGMIDDRDLMTIRRMLYLSYLDISQTDLRSIPSNAFASMRNLTTVRLPSSLKKIGRSAFESCMLIVNFDIPSRVTEIGASAFYNCKGLSDIDIPKSVVKIGDEAFMSCLSIGEVVIEGEPEIGDRAFYGCSALRSVICMSTTPPEVSANAFEGTSPQKRLGVPAEAVEAYRQHKVWGQQFTEILPASER